MMPAWTQWIVIIAASASMAAVLTVGVDIVRYRARRRRQARTFGREAENTREGGAAPHAAVEPPDACPGDMGKTHTVAGASGGNACGCGVNVRDEKGGAE